MALPELMDVGEVAKYLGLHPETIKKWIRQGKIRGTKLGNKWRVRVDSIFQDILKMARPDISTKQERPVAHDLLASVAAASRP